MTYEWKRTNNHLLAFRVLLVLFSLFFLTEGAQYFHGLNRVAFAGVTYYVDPAGNDASDGSKAGPWKTIRHAADVVAAGDTVLINPGTYPVDRQISITTSGTASNPITFKGNGTGAVVDLRSYDGRNGFEVYFADYITIDNLTVYASNDSGSRGIRLTHADGCIISNNRVSGANHANLFCSLSDHVSFLNNEAFNGAIGIYVADSSDYPVVKGNRLHNNTAIGLHMNGDINSGGDGTISYALVDGNIIHDNGATGINLDGVTRSVFQNNLVYGNTFRGMAFFKGDGAVASNDNEAYQNTIITPAGAYYGIGLNYGANRNSFYNNIVLTEGDVPSFSSTSSIADLAITSNYNLLPDHGQVVETGSGWYTLAEWQALGYDNQSVTGNLTDTFRNPEANDFQLKSGSPAIDAGTSSHTCTPDIAGNPRPAGAAPDMGAYEYTTALTAVYVSQDGLCNGKTPCYSSIQEGFDWEGGNRYVINVREGTYDEDPVLGSQKAIELRGGWNDAFTAQTSFSTIRSLQITNGTVSSFNLIVQ